MAYDLRQKAHHVVYGAKADKQKQAFDANVKRYKQQSLADLTFQRFKLHEAEKTGSFLTKVALLVVVAFILFNIVVQLTFVNITKDTALFNPLMFKDWFFTVPVLMLALLSGMFEELAFAQRRQLNAIAFVIYIKKRN
ncbi:hypothetical protein JOC36_000953 [Weissella uvarum]|uniref:hypothetical protein n=1 Tax=Weissella uvarum TaxID=1479233 RepID=UPI001961D1BA|nr:hypothetical protein [Weissella uvarum]MBM7617396.1 hypothetical protein [Weissella uvarum]MCM0595720.1 hypothetical protein [Weissella uvarum]